MTDVTLLVLSEVIGLIIGRGRDAFNTGPAEGWIRDEPFRYQMTEIVNFPTIHSADSRF